MRKLTFSVLNVFREKIEQTRILLMSRFSNMLKLLKIFQNNFSSIFKKKENEFNALTKFKCLNPLGMSDSIREIFLF